MKQYHAERRNGYGAVDEYDGGKCLEETGVEQ